MPRSESVSASQPKRQKVSEPNGLDFMKSRQKWVYMDLDREYVPAFHSVMRPYAFGPKAPSAEDVGYTLGIKAGCGRGKSWVFRQYMKVVLKENPRARILLLSANITYGSSLAHELEEEGFDAGFYLTAGSDKGVELAKHQVVVCSLESLHHVDGQRFDVILADEVRHITNLIGGSTMSYNFGNLFLLQELWRTTPLRVICDADLLYKASHTETTSAVQDLMAIIDGGPIVCARLTHPGPTHLRRRARLFYTNKKASRNKKSWEAEITKAASEWHTDREKRFAICVGAKSQLTKVSLLLTTLGVPFKPYSALPRLLPFPLPSLMNTSESNARLGPSTVVLSLLTGCDCIRYLRDLLSAVLGRLSLELPLPL